MEQRGQREEGATETKTVATDAAPKDNHSEKEKKTRTLLFIVQIILFQIVVCIQIIVLV